MNNRLCISRKTYGSNSRAHQWCSRTAGWGKICFLGGSKGWLFCGTVHGAPFIWVRSWGWSCSCPSRATSESHRSHPVLLLAGDCAFLTLGCWISQAVLETRLRVSQSISALMSNFEQDWPFVFLSYCL